jgi:hypothetical protein
LYQVSYHIQSLFLEGDSRVQPQARALPAICQKPFARSAAEGEAMVAAMAEAGCALMVHENWRWQPRASKCH